MIQGTLHQFHSIHVIVSLTLVTQTSHSIGMHRGPHGRAGRFTALKKASVDTPSTSRISVKSNYRGGSRLRLLVDAPHPLRHTVPCALGWLGPPNLPTIRGRRCSASSSEDIELQPFGSPDESTPVPPREDDVLPDSLTDALQDAAGATALAIQRGCERCVVEILLPEFWDPYSGPVYAEEGDQQRFWKLTRRFIDDVASQFPDMRLRAVYPDAGVAAMLRNQWTDAPFSVSSLNDRQPVSTDDDLVVVAAPDPPGLESLMKLSRALKPGQALVMFNPRLASGDVGVGLNMRRLQESFLKDFTITYSLRPIGDVGSVFRKYPGLWQVFVQDPELAGRYRLAAERPSRPGGEALDMIMLEAMGMDESGEKKELSLVDNVALAMSSLQRFMRSLSQ